MPSDIGGDITYIRKTMKAKLDEIKTIFRINHEKIDVFCYYDDFAIRPFYELL